MGNRDTGCTFTPEGVAARQRVVDFASRTLAAIIDEERKRFGRTSLEVFARMDVGLKKDGFGMWAPFIVEYERLPAACLWADEETAEERLNPIATRLTSHLKESIYAHRSTVWVLKQWWSFIV